MKPINGTSLMLCFLLSLVSYSWGLKFLVDEIPDNDFCGRFYCWTDVDGADQDASSIVGIAIYNVTDSGPPVKLASQSVFGQDLCVPKSNEIVNATGVVSKNYAELTLGLRNQSYCKNSVSGVFVCELSYLNATSDANKIQVAPTTVNSKSSQMCEKNLTRVKKELSDANHELAEKEKKIVALEKEVSRLENFVNVTRLSQNACASREIYNSTRKTFMLWNKIEALCDTETDGGGWIVIQRRTKGDVDFYRNWTDYRNGFGTPDTDFWIGNDVINTLTSQGYTELRIDLEYNGTHFFAHYSSFQVEDETSNYRLTVTGYNGTALDGLTYHNNMQFSTYDRDNDAWDDSCAEIWHGAWWYRDCYYANLNGVWGAKDGSGIKWSEYGSRSPAVSFSEMKIRHV